MHIVKLSYDYSFSTDLIYRKGTRETESLLDINTHKLNWNKLKEYTSTEQEYTIVEKEMKEWLVKWNINNVTGCCNAEGVHGFEIDGIHHWYVVAKDYTLFDIKGATVLVDIGNSGDVNEVIHDTTPYKSYRSLAEDIGKTLSNQFNIRVNGATILLYLDASQLSITRQFLPDGVDKIKELMTETDKDRAISEYFLMHKDRYHKYREELR